MKYNKNIYPVVVFFSLISFMLLTGLALAQNPDDQDFGSENSKLRKMEQRLDDLEEKLQQKQDTASSKSEEIKNLKERISRAERHGSADKVELSLEMEPRLWSGSASIRRGVSRKRAASATNDVLPVPPRPVAAIVCAIACLLHGCLYMCVPPGQDPGEVCSVSPPILLYYRWNAS